MIKQIVLSEEEYEELLIVQNQPSKDLRETNEKLKEKLDKVNKQQIFAPINNTNSTPFGERYDQIQFNTKEDFVMMYNYFLQKQNYKDRPSVKQADEEVFEFMQTITEAYGYEYQFKDRLAVRRYRINLIKSKLYTTDRYNTLILNTEGE